MKIDKEMQAMWTSKTTKIYRYINQIRICIVILDPCHTNKNEGMLKRMRIYSFDIHSIKTFH